VVQIAPLADLQAAEVLLVERAGFDFYEKRLGEFRAARKRATLRSEGSNFFKTGKQGQGGGNIVAAGGANVVMIQQ